MSEALAKTEEIVRKAKALGADDVVAKTAFGRYRQTRFSNNQIDISVAWNDYSTDIFLVWKKRVVGTMIHNFQNIDETVKKLVDLAKVSKENPQYGGLAQGKFSYRKSQADKKLRDLENPSEYVFEAVEAAKKEAGSNANTGGILFTKFEDVYLVSSAGPVGEDSRSAIEFSIRAFSQKEASGHGVECSSTVKGFDSARAGRKAGEIARQAKNPKVGVEGRYDVVFDPLFAAELLSTWGSMTSAYDVMIQLSVFVNKMGQKVASDMVTLRDFPSPQSIVNRVFDDEGVPTRENVLIGRGILKTYLHNTSTAKIFKAESTASAGLISPTPSNLALDPGKYDRDGLFSQVKRGLYLTNTWYTRFQNYATGDFSTIPRDGAFLIENGEIKESWKEIRLSDNVLKLLGNVAGISRERQHVYWWGLEGPPSFAPYILIKDVQITRPK